MNGYDNNINNGVNNNANNYSGYSINNNASNIAGISALDNRANSNLGNNINNIPAQAPGQNIPQNPYNPVVTPNNSFTASYIGYTQPDSFKRTYEKSDVAALTALQSDKDKATSTPKKKERKAKEKKPASFGKKILEGALIGLVAGIMVALGYFAVGKLTGRSIGAASGGDYKALEKEVAQLKEDLASQVSNSTTTVISGDNVTTVVTDVTDVVDKEMPAMVSITNLYTQTYSYWGRTYTEEYEASGSGVIIGVKDSEYIIVTNYHVVEGNVQLTAQFVDGAEVAAYVKGYDETIDIAVLGVLKSDLSALTMGKIKVAQIGDSNSLRIGEPAIAIGNALGYGQSVTTGVISALNRNIEMENTWDSLIQTSAAINPGNSGGALLNIKGEVIGINSNKLGGSTIEGMGYAIPISDVWDVIETFMNRERVERVDGDDRGYLGIKGTAVDD